MAEFTEIAKIRNRLCKAYHSCSDCPLGNEKNGRKCACSVLMTNHPEEYERICLEWAKENPEITNSDKLYQVVKDSFGEDIAFRIKKTTLGVNSCAYISCPESNSVCTCCEIKDFWKKPYIEPKESE